MKDGVMRFAGVPDTNRLEKELRERLDILIAEARETNRILTAMLSAMMDIGEPENVRGLFGEMERKRRV